jgi:GT2 family glycosyltransferase
MSTPPVRLVVVSWNTRELLERCLRSMANDIAAGLCEVVVVDNGSEDGSAAMVANRFGGTVRLIETGANLGFGTAVNRGAEAGEGAPEWIVAANADIQLEPGSLAALVAHAEQQPECGAVAPQLVAGDGSTQHSVHRFPGVGTSLAVLSGASRLPLLGDHLLIEGSWDPDRPRPVPWAHGAFVLFRASAYRQVGGFDEAQWMYAEDIDIAWRLHKAGWRFDYEPTTLVHHAGSAAATQAFGDERSARHIRAAYSWLARRRGIAYARAFAAVNCGGSAVRWAFSRVGGLLGFKTSAERAAMYRSYVKLHAQGFAPRDRLIAGEGPDTESREA